MSKVLSSHLDSLSQEAYLHAEFKRSDELRDLATIARDQEAELARLRKSVITALERRIGEAPACRLELDTEVRNAHRHLGSPIGDRPTVPSDATLRLRLELVAAEFKEFILELDARHFDLARASQEAVDLIYSTMGFFVEAGVQFRPVWDLVHRANMAKVGSTTGKWHKPPGWPKPDVAQEIERQRNE